MSICQRSLLTRAARGSAVLAVLAAASAAAAPSALAGSPATYYASAASNDTTGPCSLASPCRLDHAVNLANDGDTVIVEPGTYAVSYRVSTGQQITIEGQPGQPRPQLTGTSGLNQPTLTVGNGSTVSNLAISTDSSNGNTPALNLPSGVAENLVLTAGPQDTGGQAMAVQDAQATLVRTVLAVDQAPSGSAISISGGGNALIGLYSVTAIGTGSSSTALSVNAPSASVWVQDSILSGAGKDILGQGQSVVHVSWSDFSPATSSGYAAGSGNRSAAPVFVAPAQGDYREASGSPTIAAGTSSPLLTATDLNGTPWPGQGAPDMGAYQYTAGGGSAGGGSSPGGPAQPGRGPGKAGVGGGGLAAPGRPVADSSATIAPVSGTVTVELPGTHTFLPLAAAAQIPMGTLIDTTAGQVRLTVAVTRSGKAKTGLFGGGAFVVSQTRQLRPMTDLRMVDSSSPALCRAISPQAAGARGPVAEIAARSGRVLGTLWGRDHGGRFRTIGRGASATVRGTVWLTQDRCDGTLVRVLRGRVLVRDRARHRTVLVSAGHSYLARVRA